MAITISKRANKVLSSVDACRAYIFKAAEWQQAGKTLWLKTEDEWDSPSDSYLVQVVFVSSRRVEPGYRMVGLKILRKAKDHGGKNHARGRG